MIQKAIQFVNKELFILGPLCLLTTFAVALSLNSSVDLFLIGSIGFFLSSRGVRGFCYSLALLFIASCFRHFWMVENHLFSLGVEASLGLGFFITAICFEEKQGWLESLKNQIATHTANCQNLEEQLVKQHEETQQQQIHTQDKIEKLTKELEEIEQEHASILMLNEVLRKKTAEFDQKHQSISTNFSALQKQMEILKKELVFQEEEVVRLQNTDEMVQMNRQLKEELNEARVEKEQYRTFSEVFERQYIKEKIKAKEAEDSLDSYKDLLRVSQREKEHIKAPLEKEIEQLQQEKNSLQLEFQKVSEASHTMQGRLEKMEEIHTERNFLKERLNQALDELNGQKKQEFQEPIDSHFQERAQFAEEKLQKLVEIEHLYKQLKKQFSDKNQVLEETRKTLFQTDTKLQSVLIEKEFLEQNPIPKETQEELLKALEQIQEMKEENQALQEIISKLSSKDSPEKKK